MTQEDNKNRKWNCNFRKNWSTSKGHPLVQENVRLIHSYLDLDFNRMNRKFRLIGRKVLVARQAPTGKLTLRYETYFQNQIRDKSVGNECSHHCYSEPDFLQRELKKLWLHNFGSLLKRYISLLFRWPNENKCFLLVIRWLTFDLLINCVIDS